MRKTITVLSTLLVVSVMLAACGGEETSTSVPATTGPNMTEVPTLETASTPAAPAGTETVMPNEAGTGTPGIPVTGEEDPSRLSNELNYDVYNQSGDQIGEVNDLVVDLGASRVPYILVGTGGFLEIGEKDLLVPWEQFKLQPKSQDDQNYVFIFQGDQQVFENAPDVDINTILPPLGQPVGNWDADIVDYWQSGVVPGTAAPATTGNAMPEMTSTTAPETTNTPGAATNGTAMPGATGQLQGVVLASDLLGSNVNIGPNGAVMTNPATALGTDTPAAEATPMATNAASSAGTVVAPANPVTTANIDDVIVDINSGDIMYFVLDAAGFAEGDRWIPVPLDQFSWDAATSSYVLNVDQTMLQDAPFFQDGQYPDTTVSGWDSEFANFWQ